MAVNKEVLPEGTDTIIDISGTPGSGVGMASAEDITIAPNASRSGEAVKQAAKAVGEKTAGIRQQAAEKARDYADQGKDKAAGALEGVTKLVDNAAGAIDDKLGAQYGDYARKAAEAVSGVAGTLRSKNVDELFNDARDAVRKNPAIAIGAAAVAGFLLARVVKAGGSDAKPSARAKPPRAGKAPKASNEA